MIVARNKKQNNIAEYILYMWQVEDLVRAFNFDIEKLEQNVFGVFSESDDLKAEISAWYADIIQMMQMEQLKETGHLQITKNIINDLDGLHRILLNNTEEKEYIALYHKAAPNIFELSKKLNSENESEIQIMFHGLYGLLLMRMKKRDLTDETTAAMSTFSDLLSLLAKKYHEREKKERTQWDG